MFVTLSAILTDPTEETVISDVFLSDPTSLFILILAIVGITGEWRHRTITSSLLAAPLRVRFLAAKLLAFAAAGVLLSLAVSVVVGVIGMVILEVRDQPTPEVGELIEQFARNAGVAALLGALGRLHRRPDPQPADRDRLRPDHGLRRRQHARVPGPEVERFSPTGALPNAVQGLDPDDVGTPDVDFLAALPALALELAWIARPLRGGSRAAARARRRLASAARWRRTAVPERVSGPTNEKGTEMARVCQRRSSVQGRHGTLATSHTSRS